METDVLQFKQEDSAKQCREALFGCKWPSTNPKTLKLEFVSQIQLDDVRGILKKITKRRSDSGERFGWNGRVEHLGDLFFANKCLGDSFIIAKFP